MATDYSSTGGGGFPLIHSAPLDRPGSIKGGPYSEGAIAEPGQYARVDVADDGDTITVDLAARRYDGEIILSHTFDVDTVPDRVRARLVAGSVDLDRSVRNDFISESAEGPRSC